MYNLAAIVIALFAVFEITAAAEKPITLRRLHRSATRNLQTSAPVVSVYIPHQMKFRTKGGKRQLVHYQAPYEN